MHALPFILASASPRRVALLQMIGAAPAKILPADIDETPLPRESTTNISSLLFTTSFDYLNSRLERPP
jgi:septum formation protein